jgi:hypothetical protein
MRYPSSSNSSPAGPDSLIEEVLDEVHFTEPRYRELFSEHLVQVVSVLRTLELELSPTNVLAHIPPAVLGKLIDQLPRGQDAAPRAYLDKLPDWVLNYLSDFRQFLHLTLAEAGASGAKSVRVTDIP